MKSFKSGSYVSQGLYKSFQPSLINREWFLDDMDLIRLLEQADRELGRLDMFSEYIPNIELYIKMHMLKEATQSSKIEGTQTSMDEALMNAEDIAPEKLNDWEEVQNYISAMDLSIRRLHDLPFSSRLMKEVHQLLLQGVRGEHKKPGEFRQSQNWIGGASISDAIFVPPVHTSISELMSDLEHFVHNDKWYFPDLLKIALIHYQFETIHPFLDGNGRLGRLMIPLYLVDKGILRRPVLYLSDFFEQNRTHYYDNLMWAREKNDLAKWFKFFLVGIIETSKKGVTTFHKILSLKHQTDVKLLTLRSRTSKAQKLMAYLYQTPIMDASQAAKISQLSLASAYKLIKDLMDLQILSYSTSKRRGKLFVFNEYLKLFR